AAYPPGAAQPRIMGTPVYRPLGTASNPKVLDANVYVTSIGFLVLDSRVTNRPSAALPRRGMRPHIGNKFLSTVGKVPAARTLGPSRTAGTIGLPGRQRAVNLPPPKSLSSACRLKSLRRAGSR